MISKIMPIHYVIIMASYTMLLLLRILVTFVSVLHIDATGLYKFYFDLVGGMMFTVSSFNFNVCIQRHFTFLSEAGFILYGFRIFLCAFLIPYLLLFVMSVWLIFCAPFAILRSFMLLWLMLYGFHFGPCCGLLFFFFSLFFV